METKRVSQKEIKPMLEAITPLLASIRIEIEKMPACGRKKSLLVTQEAFEKKTALAVKELSEAKVMEYVNNHPELLQKLAHFAASDKGAIEVATEATKGENLNEQKSEKKAKKHRL